jgi:hypothetical protein
MKRIPPFPPGILDPLVVVQDHERQTLLPEVIADGETRLASTDDHGAEPLITSGQDVELSIREIFRRPLSTSAWYSAMVFRRLSSAIRRCSMTKKSSIFSTP